MMKALQMPVLLLTAGNDPDTLKAGGEGAAAGAAKGGATHDYPEMSHGWMSRGDIKDESVARDVKLAMEKTLDFFKLHL